MVHVISAEEKGHVGAWPITDGRANLGDWWTAAECYFISQHVVSLVAVIWCAQDLRNMEPGQNQI